MKKLIALILILLVIVALALAITINFTQPNTKTTKTSLVLEKAMQSSPSSYQTNSNPPAAEFKIVCGCDF